MCWRERTLAMSSSKRLLRLPQWSRWSLKWNWPSGRFQAPKRLFRQPKWRRAICLRQLHFVKGLHRIKILVIRVSDEGHSLCSKKDNPCVRRRTFLTFEEAQSLCSKKNFPCVRRRTFLVFKEGYYLCSKKDIPCVRRKTFLLFEEGHSLCSKKDIPCVRGRRNAYFWSYRPQEGCIWSKIWCRSWFWRQELPSSSKIGLKSRKTEKKLRKIFQKKIGVKKSKVANRPKRVFPTFRGDRSEVRGASGKFWCGARRCRIKSRKQMARRHLNSVLLS